MQSLLRNVASPSVKRTRRKPRLAFQLANGWGIKGFVHSGILNRLADEFELAAWVQPMAMKPWTALMDRGESPRVTLFPEPVGVEGTAERLIRQTQRSLFFA